MDIDVTEGREARTGDDDRAGTGRCGWIALGLVILLIPGIAPVSFFFGIVSAHAVADAFGRHLGQGIIGRLMVMAAAATAVLLSAVILFFLTVTIRRMIRGLVRRSPAALRKPRSEGTPVPDPVNAAPRTRKAEASCFGLFYFRAAAPYSFCGP